MSKYTIKIKVTSLELDALIKALKPWDHKEYVDGTLHWKHDLRKKLQTKMAIKFHGRKKSDLDDETLYWI